MLSGKSAIVTGSTSGIGLGIARGLAASGINIMLNGFGDAGEIEAIRSEIAASHDIKVLYNGANMADANDIAAMMAQAHEAFGGVDILVNNAGIQYVAPLEDFPVEKWDAIIAINLSSAFHTTRLAIPGMKAKKWGRIVNIASAHALVASPFKSAYVAAKHGIAGLTKTAALELAEHGITVNAVCPGYVMTPLVEKQIPEQAKARGITEQQVISEVLLAAQPTKRFVTVEELSAFVNFLCSDPAQSVTGTTLPVDGGWTAH
jgi:3-hydroxybutyrate dehydrogenase